MVEESDTLAAVGRGEAPDTPRIEDGRKLLALEPEDGTDLSAPQAPTEPGRRVLSLIPMEFLERLHILHSLALCGLGG